MYNVYIDKYRNKLEVYNVCYEHTQIILIILKKRSKCYPNIAVVCKEYIRDSNYSLIIDDASLILFNQVLLM